MQIKALKANAAFDVVEGTVTELSDVRTFQKFGKPGRVRNGKVKDDSGEVKLTLWNEQIDSVNEGDHIKIMNGYTTEWQGQVQISTGRNGTLEVSGKSASAAGKKPAKKDEPQEELDDLDVEEEEI